MHIYRKFREMVANDGLLVFSLVQRNKNKKPNKSEQINKKH